MADEQGTIATAPKGTAQGDTTQPLATDTQQPQATQSKTPAIDLEKELQRIKSQMGREAAEVRRQAQAAQDRAAAAERQIRDARLSTMDELERAKFERDEAFQYAESMRLQTQRAQQDAQRERDVAELVAEYGAPAETFVDAVDYADAVKRARAYEKAQKEAQIEERVAKRLQKAEANTVDIGGGKPLKAGDMDEKFREARKSGSAVELAKLLIRN